MRYFITDHAVDRYAERVQPGIDRAIAVNILETLAPSSALMRTKTFGGQEQRSLDKPVPCVLVCKRDPGRNQIAVVTVLGSDEILSEADSTIADEFVEHAGDGIAGSARGQVDNARRQGKKLPTLPDDELRRIVAACVRNEVAQRIDKFVGADARRQQTAKTEENRASALSRARVSGDVYRAVFPALARLAADDPRAASIIQAALGIDPSIGSLVGRGLPRRSDEEESTNGLVS